MFSPLAVEVEPDDDGYHALVTDGTDAVVHVTNTYARREEAARAAWDWILTRKEILLTERSELLNYFSAVFVDGPLRAREITGKLNRA